MDGPTLADVLPSFLSLLDFFLPLIALALGIALSARMFSFVRRLFDDDLYTPSGPASSSFGGAAPSSLDDAPTDDDLFPGSFCPSCWEELPPDALYCIGCGRPAPATGKTRQL